jgi:dolichyl-phosphate-mannose--protein O-mannosyl transferase
MSDDEFLEEWGMMVKEIVSMYRAVWVEMEHQFSTSSADERLRICSFISPLINNMLIMAFNESKTEDTAKASSKRKKKR